MTTCTTNKTDRRYADSLVYNRDSYLATYILSSCHKITCQSSDLIIYLFTTSIKVVVCALKQIDTHCDGADIQCLLLNHFVGFKNLVYIYHIG